MNSFIRCLWFLWVGLAFASCAHSAESANALRDVASLQIPVSGMDKDQSAYPTADAAAIAALEASARLSSTVEYAGAVYYTDGVYHFTVPVPGDETQFAVRLRFVGKLAAIYHTHPGKDGVLTSQFSPQDKRTAKQLGIPSYIQVLANGDVLRLTGSSVAQLNDSEGLCHGLPCAEYHARQEHAVLVAYGLARQ